MTQGNAKNILFIALTLTKVKCQNTKYNIQYFMYVMFFFKFLHLVDN